MRRALVLLTALAALLGSERALTASSAVGPSRAGSGAAAIGGYAVTGVAYALDGDRIATVAFDLSPAGAETVRVRLSPTSAWHACAVAGGGASCAVDEPVAAATSLDVVATGHGADG